MLDATDRKGFIDLVKGKAYLIKQEKLESIFIKSGLQDLRTLVEFDLSGGAEAMLYNLITFLEDYGKIRPDHEALGLFLIAIYDFVGLDVRQCVVQLLDKYKLVPIAEIPNIPSSESGEKTDQISNVSNTGLKIRSPSQMFEIVKPESKSEIVSSVQPNVSRGSPPNERGNKDPSFGYYAVHVMKELNTIMTSDIPTVKNAVQEVIGKAKSKDDIEKSNTVITVMLIPIIRNFKDKYTDMIEKTKKYLDKTWEDVSPFHDYIYPMIIDLEECIVSTSVKTFEQISSATQYVETIEEQFKKLPEVLFSSIVAYSGGNIP